jgi:ubiquinone/menaquinone biosynthesis C-methylase UbiE
MDLGCGLGDLTHALKTSLPESIEVMGCDVDPTIIGVARKRYPNINFDVADMYSLSMEEDLDFLYSNETFHWAPKLPERYHNVSGCIYPFFPKKERNDYIKWSLQNISTSLKGVFRALKPGGLAFLQFGLDGQLIELYKVLNQSVSFVSKEALKKISLPLYYPTLKSLCDLIDSSGFQVDFFRYAKDDLSEQTANEILHFVRAFTENGFISAVGENTTQAIYDQLFENLGNIDISRIYRRGWNHCILVLQK